MALRFRRSLKLAPGLRLNFSGSGISASTGVRGASVTFGSRGTFLNGGLPGTGLYARARLDSAASRPSDRFDKVSIRATIRVEDDGTVIFLDENGQRLGDHLVDRVKRQHGSQIREMLETACVRINEETDGIARIHCHTPNPKEVPRYQRAVFQEEAPMRPLPKAAGLFDRLIGRGEKIELQNAEATRRYVEAATKWEAAKASFDAQENRNAAAFDGSLRNDEEFMQHFLESRLKAIAWPRETLISFELAEQASSVMLDLDLPEIEDIQRKAASLPERGYKLSLKDIKGKALQVLYAQHIHGVGFRIIGEVFATLPTVQSISLSAFTQRNDSATGHAVDTYVYSVRIPRAQWSEINFTNLGEIDIISALERFDFRRKLTRSGVLQAIEPF